MKKSILGTLGLVIVFSLIIGDRLFLKEETADDHGQAVAMANSSADGGMIIIEEGEVPLAAAIPTGGEETSGEAVSEQERSETDLIQRKISQHQNYGLTQILMISSTLIIQKIA